MRADGHSEGGPPTLPSSPARQQGVLQQDWPLGGGEAGTGVRTHLGPGLAQVRVGEVEALRVVLVDVQFIWLCVLDLESAAAAVDVASVQALLRSPGRLQAVELQHGLHSVLLKDDDSQQFAEGRGDGVEDLAGDGIGGVEHCEEQHMVGLLSLCGFLGELELHQLRREQYRVASQPLHTVGVVVNPRPLGQRPQALLVQRDGGHPDQGKEEEEGEED